MKFSHSIQFNAVPEWSSHYINYSNLKKLIYQLEKVVHRDSTQGQDAEASPLLSNDPDPDVDIIFQRALDVELDKIGSFYRQKELELYGELDDLLRDGEQYAKESEHHDGDASHAANHRSSGGKEGRPRSGSMFQGFSLANRARRSSAWSASLEHGDDDAESDEDDADETAALTDGLQRRKTVDGPLAHRNDDQSDPRDYSNRRRAASIALSDFPDESFSALLSSGITIKKRTIGLYVNLCELRSFSQLNRTGFTKALKKFDKILDRQLKTRYMTEVVGRDYAFQKSTMEQLDNNIRKVEKTYATVVTKGDDARARRELRLHLREHVVWERNTVWREMIGIERKAQAANLGIRRTLLGDNHDPSKARLQGDDAEDVHIKVFQTPLGRYRIPTLLTSLTFYILLSAVTVFAALLLIPFMESRAEQNCLAMLVFVSLLWATEVIPLFVTALLIPFLTVVLRIMREDAAPHRRLDAAEATSKVFASMWTPVIMLLLGGFTIAAALSKYHIAKIMATFVLSKAGTKPHVVLLTNMFVAMLASMWISNVAAPVLCFSIIQPLLRNMSPESNFPKALILGIALASNVGGAASPIASPQNIIAIQNMDPDPSWLIWFFVALPVCVTTICLIWVLLILTFQPGRGTKIVPLRQVKDRFTGIQWFVSITTVATIVLWCLSHQLQGVLGDMGVIAIIPMVLFFGTGILTKEDFNNFLWTIIILAAGGLSLGRAVASSGLLETIAEGITLKVQNMGLYGVLFVFAVLILVVATFISHTVAALIILPLVRQVGENMPDAHPNLLVMSSALMCSAAMGLPTSGFPNMTAIMMEDPQTGRRYLRVKHFISRGIPSSLVNLLVVTTLGYALMRVVQF